MEDGKASSSSPNAVPSLEVQIDIEGDDAKGKSPRRSPRKHSSNRKSSQIPKSPRSRRSKDHRKRSGRKTVALDPAVFSHLESWKAEHMPHADNLSEVIAELIDIAHVHIQGSGPIIAFVNPKSGGQQGQAVYNAFSKLLPPERLYNVMERDEDGNVKGPDPGLLRWNGKKFRVVAAGGDGTIGWTLQRIDELGIAPAPPVAPMPLGTGNDLSRILGWGGTYVPKMSNPVRVMADIDVAEEVQLDRWDVVYTPLTSFDPKHARYSVISDLSESLGPDEASSTMEGDATSPSSPRENGALEIEPGAGELPDVQTLIMNNYWSIGIDAEIALDFHKKRESNTHYFQNLLVNKGWYGAYGLKTFTVYHGPIRRYARVWVDGKPLSLGSLLPGDYLRGIIILNLQSYGGGTDPWGTSRSKKYEDAAFDDGLLEVVGLKSAAHLGGIQAGLSGGIRLAQGSSVKIRTSKALPAQIDGEPTMLIPCDITITHHGTSTMLFNTKSKLAYKTEDEEKEFASTSSGPVGVIAETLSGVDLLVRSTMGM